MKLRSKIKIKTGYVFDKQVNNIYLPSFFKLYKFIIILFKNNFITNLI